ncbi:MAG: phenylpyruvate tautomerase PptA (4-oxalocrotonate tautomerase family) [Paracoccaceae bacterium]|jgi:phenylpyruvate tautomerase PptA (4-oxalocrotonate tautomerase family)
MQALFRQRSKRRSGATPPRDIEAIEGVCGDKQKARIIEKVTATAVEVKGENLRAVTGLRAEVVRSGRGRIGAEAQMRDRQSGIYKQAGHRISLAIPKAIGGPKGGPSPGQFRRAAICGAPLQRDQDDRDAEKTFPSTPCASRSSRTGTSAGRSP